MLQDLSPEFIERYQILLSEDPKSKVFAPLAEAYRKLGWLPQAEKICVDGVKYHPHFPSGRVVLAKILIDSKKLEEAIEQLRVATDLSPDNILAHRLLGQSLLDLRRPKEALKAFKMVLLLNPNDQNATKTVKKLESLTADEYDDELFQMKPLQNAAQMISQNHEYVPLNFNEEATPKVTSVSQVQRTLDRALSLADAFVVRNDFDKALDTLESAEQQIGTHPEITKRRRFLMNRNQQIIEKEEEPEALQPIRPNFEDLKEKKINSLKNLLQRVNDRRVE